MKNNKKTLVTKMLIGQDLLEDRQILKINKYEFIGGIIEREINRALEENNKRISKVKNPVEIIVKVKTANK